MSDAKPAVSLPRPTVSNVSLPSVKEFVPVSPGLPNGQPAAPIAPKAVPGMSFKPNVRKSDDIRYRCGCQVPLIGRIDVVCERHGQPKMDEVCPACGRTKAGKMFDKEALETENKEWTSPCICKIPKREIDRFQIILQHVIDGCPRF
jgi:hypothetical protein